MKIILVTGGSSGIGLEAVKRYIALGHQVITCSRTSSKWQTLVDEDANLAKVDYFEVDITNIEKVTNMFNDISKKYGRLDVAINNASPAIEAKGVFKDIEPEALEHTLKNDFWAHVICIKQALQLMKNGASIVNVSSVNGIRPAPGAAMYSAAKHGVEGLTKSIALEAIKDGIRLNTVAPGLTWTDRWAVRINGDAAMKTEISKAVPIERFARVDEIVDAIEFLASEKASYIVGHTLVIDGGISIS